MRNISASEMSEMALSSLQLRLHRGILPHQATNHDVFVICFLLFTVHDKYIYIYIYTYPALSSLVLLLSFSHCPQKSRSQLVEILGFFSWSRLLHLNNHSYTSHPPPLQYTILVNLDPTPFTHCLCNLKLHTCQHFQHAGIHEEMNIFKN